MTRYSDEAWLQTLPLITEPVERPVRPMEPVSFNQHSKGVTCAQCGTVFRRMRATARYCSNTCRHRAFKGKQ